jgi:hypothetical protein
MAFIYNNCQNNVPIELVNLSKVPSDALHRIASSQAPRNGSFSEQIFDNHYNYELSYRLSKYFGGCILEAVLKIVDCAQEQGKSRSAVALRRGIGRDQRKSAVRHTFWRMSILMRLLIRHNVWRIIECKMHF